MHSQGSTDAHVRRPRNVNVNASLPRTRNPLTSGCCCSLQTAVAAIATLSLLNGFGALCLSVASFVFEGHFIHACPFFIKLSFFIHGTMQFFSGLSCMYGVDKRRPPFIKPWFAVQYTELAIGIIAFTFMISRLLTSGLTGGSILAFCGSFCVNVGIFVYCVVTVGAFCKEITNSEKTHSLAMSNPEHKYLNEDM